MHHVLSDGAIQLGVDVRVWDLCTDQTVDINHCARLDPLFKHQEVQMEVRQAPFLELNHTNMSFDLAQEATGNQQMQYLLDLLYKDPGNDVRPDQQQCGQVTGCSGSRANKHWW